MKGKWSTLEVSAYGTWARASCRLCVPPRVHRFAVYNRVNRKGQTRIGMRRVLQHFRRLHPSLLQPLSCIGRASVEASSLLLQDEKGKTGKMASRKALQQPGMALLPMRLSLASATHFRAMKEPGEGTKETRASWRGTRKKQGQFAFSSSPPFSQLSRGTNITPRYHAGSLSPGTPVVPPIGMSASTAQQSQRFNRNSQSKEKP